MKRFGVATIIGIWLILLSGIVFAEGTDQDDSGQAIEQGQQGQGAQKMSVDTYIELMRTDLRAQKKAAVSKAMELTPEQEKAFWPIYNDYEHDMIKLTDVGIGIVKDYAKVYQNMTDEAAKDLIDRTFKNQDNKLKLKKTYAKKFEKALSPRIAARFLQVDGVLTKMIELQIDSQIPLIK
jgi:hypothetical protein